MRVKSKGTEESGGEYKGGAMKRKRPEGNVNTMR